MKLKIAVTAKDIKAGEKEAGEGCPIALAAKRAGLQGISVGREDLEYRLASGNGTGSIDLPKKAQTFVERFDDGQSVKPFSFVLDFNKDNAPALAKKTKKTAVAA